MDKYALHFVLFVLGMLIGVLLNMYVQKIQNKKKINSENEALKKEYADLTKGFRN